MFFFLSILGASAQYDRLPINISIGLSIPNTTSNAAFNKSAKGNLDWKNSFSYAFKNKNLFSIVYKRSNFKLGSLSNKFNTDLKSKYIINHFGVGYERVIFNNDYISINFGLVSYYSHSSFIKIVVDDKVLKNQSKAFLSFEPNFLISYKAAKYVDLSFHLSETITAYRFNPYDVQLDKSNIGITYEPSDISNQRLTYLSFGFQVSWYFEFENTE